MTEIERLIKDGIFEEDFFKEEVRNGFLVDTERKKLWAIEIDLLLQIDKVCKENNLKYFLMAGTLLGAVRHGGFIPWDDDIDIVLPRKDYEILLELKNEFSFPYFLQTPYTDQGYYYSHAKLRNANTSAVDKPFLYQGFNMGIFVDIIPLDLVDDKNGREKFSIISDLIIQNSVAMRLTNPNLNERDKNRVKSYKGGNPLERYEKIQELAKSDNDTDTILISPITGAAYGYDRMVYYKEDFSKAIYCSFEGFNFPIPIGYERILNTEYMNYKQLPPVPERGQRHSSISFDTDVSYITVVEKILDN